MKLCACGCGNPVAHKRNTWVKNHDPKTRIFTEARRENQIKATQARRKPVEQTFREFTIQGRNGCIEWTGAKDPSGYPRCRNRFATHWALEMSGRPRPSNKHWACHTCDNPACVNPDHLWWGTNSENMKDCVAKGRADLSGLALGSKAAAAARSVRAKARRIAAAELSK